MERTEEGDTYPLGSKMPSFSLPATDGENYGNAFFADAKAGLIVFTCNHCPYVKGSDFELFEILSRYSGQGLKALLISSNDPTQYSDDSFEQMKFKAEEFNIPFPYCFDESQDVARAFDAQCTPECFLYDAEGTYVFHGPINDSPREPAKVAHHILDLAVQDVLSGKVPDPQFNSARGCSIKWKVRA